MGYKNQDSISGSGYIMRGLEQPQVPVEDAFSPEQGGDSCQGEDGGEGNSFLTLLLFSKEQDRGDYATDDCGQNQGEEYQGKADSKAHQGRHFDIAKAHPTPGEDNHQQGQSKADTAADGRVLNPGHNSQAGQKDADEQGGYHSGVDYPVQDKPVLEVNHHKHDKEAAVEGSNRQLSTHAVLAVEAGKQCSVSNLYPQDAPGNSSPAVAAAAAQPQVAQDGDEVFYRQAVPAGGAVGGGGDERLPGGQTVDADVKETGDDYSEYGEGGYSDSIHIALYSGWFRRYSQMGEWDDIYHPACSISHHFEVVQ